MHEPSFTTLLDTAYTRSDLTYKISLLRAFLEFTFFTENKSVVEKEGIDRFLEKVQKNENDINFLRTFSEDFFQQWKKDTFYDTLNKYGDAIEKLPVLSLVVPVEFSTSQLKKIGEWARKEVDHTVLLKIRVDSRLSVGCRFVWNNRLYDFSLEHYFHQHRRVLHTRLASLVPKEGVNNK